jgi:phosphatidylinositol glycan class V
MRTVILAFFAWKLFLLLVALASPGRGYDTSTSLVLHAAPQHLQHLQSAKHKTDLTTEGSPLPSALHYLATKLTRWDAIYFTQAAARGYRFEQEWAFGWGLTRLIALVTAGK